MLNRWTNKLTLSASLIGVFSTIAIVQPQVSFSLTPEQVNEKAKAFTVKIDGAKKGSGVIIAKSGNKYTVLTNWHVVNSEKNYIIQTRDETTHQGVNIQQIQRADLAVIYFNSSQSYQVARKANSDDLSEGQTIHYAGYPTTQGRVYRFFGSKSITGFLSDAKIENMSEAEQIQFQQGYDIIFEGTGLDGISGGPILDDNSNLIGIAGAGSGANSGGASLYGIPINTAQKLAKRTGINLAWLTPIQETFPSSTPTTNPSQSTPSNTTQPSVSSYTGYCTFFPTSSLERKIVNDRCRITKINNNLYTLKWSYGQEMSIALNPASIDGYPGTLIFRTATGFTVKTTRGRVGFCWNCQP